MTAFAASTSFVSLRRAAISPVAVSTAVQGYAGYLVRTFHCTGMVGALLTADFQPLRLHVLLRLLYSRLAHLLSPQGGTGLLKSFEGVLGGSHAGRGELGFVWRGLHGCWLLTAEAAFELQARAAQW